MVVDRAPSQKSFRRRAYEQLEPSARLENGISLSNKFLVVVILLGTMIAVLSTEATLTKEYAVQFQGLELLIGSIFAVEYLVRIWIAAEEAPLVKGGLARLRFVFSLSGLLDLLVIVATFSQFFNGNIALLRIISLFRLLQLAKLGRMSAALKRLTFAVHSRRYELGLTIGLALALLLFGATALYWLEGELQPDKFGSIPRSLWWAVITMTTIGYGDVYPITTLGKIVASLVALAGIGLIAMPTGILAAAFSDAMQRDED